MKLLTLSLCISLMATASLFAQSKKQLQAEVQRLSSEIEALKKPKEIDLNDRHVKASYAIGMMIGTNVKGQGIDSLEVDALMLAIEDLLLDRDLKLETGEAEEVLQQYMQEVMIARRTKAIEESAAYLEQNKAREGVRVTDSGLQYQVLQEGTGKTPGPDDKVRVHYTGMLTDGTVFDSSVERGEPITVNVNQIIPGWSEALQLMKEGGKWRLVIPYPLAYGERGAGRDIPPYATLIFEVELLKIE